MDEVFLARVRVELSMGSSPERLLQIIEQARGRAIIDLLMGRGQGEKAKSMSAKEGERRISALQSRLWSAKSPIARQKLLDQIFQAESDMMAFSMQADRDRQFQGKRNLIANWLGRRGQRRRNGDRLQYLNRAGQSCSG